jgi:hypothetical protein
MLRRLVTWAGAFAVTLAALGSPPALASTFGINAHVPSEAIQDEIVAAGVGWVRVDVVWGLIELHRDSFDWERYDRLIDTLESRGLRIFATLQGTPQWATSGSEFSGVPDDPADWREFCYLVASRYRGRIDAWGFWNEPNLGHFWQGNRTQYVNEILLPGIEAVSTADPGSLLVAADLAHLSSGSWEVWMARVLNDAGHLLDVFSHHVYPSNGTAGNVTYKLSEGGSLPWDPPPVREVLDDGGWGDRPFWLTETGVESDAYGQTGQSAFYGNLLGLWFGSGRSHDWIDRIFFYEMADPSNDPTLSWGVLEAPPGLERKLAFFAYLDFIADAVVDDAEIAAEGLPAFAGSRELLEPSFQIRNTGTTTWTASAGYRLAVEIDDIRWQVAVDPLPDSAAVSPGDAIILGASLLGPNTFPFEAPRVETIEARMQLVGERKFGSGIRHLLVLTAREPPRLIRPPAPASAPYNGSAAFSVEVASPTAESYQWRRNTVALADDHRHAGTTTPELSVSGVGFDSLGDYDCVVTNDAGSIASPPAALTLAGEPIRRPGERLPGELPELYRRWLEFRRLRPAAAGEDPPDAARTPSAAEVSRRRAPAPCASEFGLH